MKRREALKYAATAVIGAPFLSTVLFGSTSIPSSIIKAYKPVFFSDKQLLLVKSIADTILPKTDSPSASEVGVPEKIDSMIPVIHSRNEQADFMGAFKMLESKIANEVGGKDFSELPEEDRFRILQIINNSNSSELEAVRWVLWNIKSKAVDYYRKSRVIATEFLNYLPVPGYYDPCVSLSELGGKAWAI